jgi:phosphoserine phosphatase
MSTLLLLRHGEVPGISPPKFRGRTELELTERGRAQAERTAERVKAGWPQVAAIFCSPRHRTVATAETVGRRYGIAPRALPEFSRRLEDWAFLHSFPKCQLIKKCIFLNEFGVT